jgi:aspartyl-tRNA(Asn)/glutamyl-tRNA(Gln) amidotransferase subunit A
MSDPALLDLNEIAVAIATRRVSSVEATQACLARIKAWQPAINAFIRIDEESALRQAAECDAELAAGRRRGPLHGVPLAHKDLLYREGKVTTGGSKILRDTVAGTTSTLLERLDAAGAVDLGTLNMSEFAAGPTGHNIHYGPARNPYDRSRITGGSSSGSGAAVGARLVFGSLGSDTGGSIRLPAAACNVTGLKATYGRVSRHGAIARSWSLDHIGPLARTARDCGLIFAAIAGHDPRDPSTSARPLPDLSDMDNMPFASSQAGGPGETPLRISLAGLRIGVPGEAILKTVEPGVAAALEQSWQVLQSGGAALKEVDFPDLAKLADIGETIIKSEAATMHRHWLETRPNDYARQVRVRIEGGFYIPATQYLDALRLRGVLLGRFLKETMGDIDLLHAPVIPFPLPTIAETDVETETGSHVLDLVRRITAFTRPFNFLGVPAVSVPCGFDPAGLPIAYQLIGRPFAEALCLRAAAAYQSATEFHRIAPQL